jgi:hypothetical protein
MITLNFDGIEDYIEIADDARFSVATTGRLTVAAWMRPYVLAFLKFESTGYVHWLGKGEIGSKNGRSECTTKRPLIFRRGQIGSVSMFSTCKAV